jgi:iduronate 2-sulfatase
MKNLVFSLLFLALTWDILAGSKPNVLFIAVDDLRMNLGCYGDEVAVTPNIDRLAGKSVRFNRAYCQFASCNASRASLLTGQRPDTISVYNLNTNYRDTAPDVVTLPQHFKEQGYHTEAVGKVLHNYYTSIRDNDLSWSVPARFDKLSHFTDYALEENIPLVKGKKTIVAELADVGDDAYYDGEITEDAIRTIERLSTQDQPFFLAVGFMKPHSPYNAPKKYWDLYQREDMKALSSVTRPDGMSELNWWESREIRTFPDVPSDGLIPSEKEARMRHGYYAATSYLDANIGRVLEALDTSGVADNTIIVFWSDHGYHLGENRHWSKVTLRELDAQVPLLVSVPGSLGTTTDAIVEYVDLYPTLSELCDLTDPVGLDGRSFLKVLKNPGAEFRSAALTQVCRPWSNNVPIETMGYSIRTPGYRFTQWVDHNTKTILSEEIYDLKEDLYQRNNLIKQSGISDVVSAHRKLLKQKLSPL